MVLLGLVMSLLPVILAAAVLTWDFTPCPPEQGCLTATHFVLYRGTSAPAGPCAPALELARLDLSQRTFTDHTATAGALLCYRVATRDDAGHESLPSNTLEVRCAPPVLPPPMVCKDVPTVR